ncbi:MAG: efflux RND transporter periplasmic adaptor subunit [Candidatus Omnitrophica bacterium]|nr:efflux RND transporter periplasmic adaptor subunit [Candidatus Omnitrophota bacterium]
MNKKTKFSFIIILLLAVTGILVFIKTAKKQGPAEVSNEISPMIGSVRVIISTTGTVYPKNRLEIKPPVSGRIESVLVKEGDNVKEGETLALMSSTERAALLDAARAKGEEELKYWQEAYKPIVLLAPINGEVIVATTQPGQTVTTSDAVVVLSDQLIVRAEVDETDIGRVKLEQKAVISLDAYPDDKINAAVDHIYYESETSNNVTIYKVDLVPDEVPEFFRSGMNATIDFIEKNSENAMLLPVEAVYIDEGNNEGFVFVKQEGSDALVKRMVKIGITDDENYEILSGLDKNDKVVVTSQEYILPQADDGGSNPFMPNMRRGSSSKK